MKDNGEYILHKEFVKIFVVGTLKCLKIGKPIQFPCKRNLIKVHTKRKFLLSYANEL